MKNVTCVGLIPAEDTVNPKLGLNVLAMAVNHCETAVSETVSIFGSDGSVQKLLVSKCCILRAGEHAHLYFHIPSCCFAADFWDGQAPEELVIFGGTDCADTDGNLIFIEL